jgi:hypothetical protein
MKKQTKDRRKSNASNAEQTNKEVFPGYPVYPPKEDIMNRGKRIDVDINTAIENNQPIKNTPKNEVPGNLGTNEKNSNLTQDDFQALASDEVESTGDDEILTSRVWPVDFAGKELDVPGSELDDAQEEVGSEDEENNSYSIGGDRHEDLEEDRS